MGTFGNRTGKRLLAGGVFVVLLGLAAAPAAAQSWRAELARLQGETAKIIEKAREQGQTDLSGLDAEFARLEAEYLEKVIRPALAEARTCRARMDAVQLVIGIERQAQLFGRSLFSVAELATMLSGTYGEQAFERCMNELYRACVVEDNPLYTLTMVAWKIGWERQKQLLGASADQGVDLSGELDPRITKCRGPWYQVRIVMERSGTEPDTGFWKDSDIAEGWMGRGLNTTRSRASQTARHPGDFHRRTEQVSSYARCPDGGCGESCGFTAAAEGRARVEYELEVSHAYRMLSIGFLEGEGEEKIEKNACPHTDLPIALPGTVLLRFPADVVAPLVDEPARPGGADPKVTEAIDEWPRMFPSKSVQLDDEGDRPAGTLEVQRVCDGQEIWGRGPAECQRKWQEYLEASGAEAPVAPWERRTPKQ
jgi:hypothetical protein